MKFINYIENIAGVDLFGLVGLLICFIVFTAVSIWAWKADKKLMNKMGNIPLEN
ncbi:MAG TPA: CcoQ/FixQ family Cbb3-type cytochrome c oxidase assembly chaperone [Panacibacter sp.]|nr:CcoQ/FixQ family Cbb3-type cytochrome c oxidase assembly chaperone [Panacibacter sp.]